MRGPGGVSPESGQPVDHTVLIGRGEAEGADEVRLSEDEARHLHVKRIQGGTMIRWIDGAGTSGTAVVTIRSDTEAHLRLVERLSAPEPLPLVLGVGAGDRERFAVLVEKATELGVTHIYPLVTERSQNVSSRVRGEHVEKLQRRSQEAAKQSGNPWAATVHPPCGIPEFIERTAFLQTRMMADATGHPVVMDSPEFASAIAIGPEGGFVESERAALVEGGFAPVSFGPYMLRFETAAIAAASICQAIRAGFEMPT